MLKNNIDLDVKTRCIEKGITQADLAEAAGITPSYVNRIIRKNGNIVNRTFLKIMETLGYDVEMVYVRRESSR